MAHKTDHAENAAHVEHHIMPFNVYVKVAGALFILTFLTVGAHVLKEHYPVLQPFGGLVAFAIAAVKAYLVMAFFMHLKYDVPSNRIIFSTGFIFLGVFIFFSALDIYTRIFQGSVL